MCETLKKLREQSGLTQENIAEAVGVGQSAISMWETGKSKPRADMLIKLAAILGCTVDELLHDENKETAERAV